MGINHIRLSPELIASLYPDSLLAGPGEPSRLPGPVDLKAAAGYSFLGGNKRHVCFLTNTPGASQMPAGQFSFLNKILTACKYGMEDIAIVNGFRNDFTFSALTDQLKPRILFLWGAERSAIGLDPETPEFTIIPFGDMSVIVIPEPEIMTREGSVAVERKQRLWTVLKKLFQL